MTTVPDVFAQLDQALASPELSDDFIVRTTAIETTEATRAAVLIALSRIDDPDVIFIERARTLRKHPGQIAFPGGRVDDDDDGPIDTALREAQEEVGLEPSSVTVLGTLPAAAVPVSRFNVTGVVAHWDGCQQVKPMHASEVASVHRWSISTLSDPATRVASLHPSGQLGPAWRLGEYFLWGFTALLVDNLLRLGGWERSWDRSQIVEVPRRYRSDSAQLAVN